MAERVVPLAQAVWFGGDPVRSFGMLHRPAAAGPRGVVVCNALGFEGLLAHRPLRHLATALAGHGLTVVRVDYSGTGDAPGTDAGPADVQACLDSIDDAVRLLREAEGCSQIAVVGIRAGATLAGHYSLTHPGISELVLWAPFEQGKGYVRELKALSRLSGASRPAGNPPPQPGDPLEVVGFEFDKALLDGLTAVDLLAPSETTVPRVLLVDRDDAPAADDLAERLRASGSAVDRNCTSGWAEFMVSDETESVLPEATLDAIASWLARQPDEPAGAMHATGAAEHPIRATTTYEADGIHERSAWIDGRLFTLVTSPTPAASASANGAPTRHQRVVIMPNTGSVNRTGPGRLYIQLARQWAGLGLAVVRVDLGGTGDSPTEGAEPENRPYDPARIAELLDVVAWARANVGDGEISLFGICSGAFQSFHAALLDADIGRVMLVNPAIFYLGPDQTVGTSTSKAMIATHNLLRLRFLQAQVKRALRSPKDLGQFWRRAVRGFGYSLRAWARPVLRRAGIHLPEREHLARDLQRLADSDVELVVVFASDEPGWRYLHVFGGTVLDELEQRRAVTVVEIPGGDHVFSPPQARRAMTSLVTDHLLPAGSSVATTPAPVPHG
jgi:pimeloyl-ACP methyl ester carboxylesterase